MRNFNRRYGLVALLALAFAPSAASAQEDPLAAYLWEARPVVVFADSIRDPRFQEQMQSLDGRPYEMERRDIVILTDTEPAGAGPLRRKLRPRGFMMVIVDKDGRIIQRAPHPMSADALMRLIDRTPLRRREIDERRGLAD